MVYLHEYVQDSYLDPDSLPVRVGCGSGIFFCMAAGCSAMKTGFSSIDEYIGTFPPEIRTLLEELRQAIQRAAPDAEETISYQMPAFRQNGILVYFAAFKNHIGFFPTASGIEAFKEELAQYRTSKGTV